MPNEIELFVSLYTDEDVTNLIAKLLRERGFNAVSARDVGMLKKSDDEQLEYAVERKMTILVYNRDDFLEIDKKWRAAQRTHYGILISEQFSSRQISEFLRRLTHFLDHVTADEMINLVRYLPDFK
jgi:predicted nuclease of predicted toxin-antitoxin system